MKSDYIPHSTIGTSAVNNADHIRCDTNTIAMKQPAAGEFIGFPLHLQGYFITFKSYFPPKQTNTHAPNSAPQRKS